MFSCFMPIHYQNLRHLLFMTLIVEPLRLLCVVIEGNKSDCVIVNLYNSCCLKILSQLFLKYGGSHFDSTGLTWSLVETLVLRPHLRGRTSQIPGMWPNTLGLTIHNSGWQPVP